MAGSQDGDQSFDAFMRAVEPRLRRALVAAYGGEAGREATADAFAYAWEHWPEIGRMRNPAGYLFRVGQSSARRGRRAAIHRRPVWDVAHESVPAVEPGLATALARLTRRQRIAVVLVHGYGLTLREVAELTGTAIPTVQKHAERGLAGLRSALHVHERTEKT